MSIQATERVASSRTAVTVGLQMEVIEDHAGLRALRHEWAGLHDRSMTTNPFTHPDWCITWATHFVGPGRLSVVVARDGGRLVAVAPFYRAGPAIGGRPVARALHLLGNGPSSQFTETPSLLVQSADRRRLLRAVMAFVQEEMGRWDWVKVTLDPQQGWFEPQWVERQVGRRSPFPVHVGTRSSVVVDLPDTWSGFLATRKRNVRESVRRSRNRLDKRSGGWSVDVVADPSDQRQSLDRMIELHAARSALRGKPAHPTMFPTRAAAEFYRDAILTMAACGRAEISRLRVGGEMMAALVTLRANGVSYLSSTGADPAAWDYGAGTMLIAELARREIQRGGRRLNLSAGPSQFKLSWSEHLEFDHDFVMVGSGRAAQLRFKLYNQWSARSAMRRAQGWDSLE